MKGGILPGALRCRGGTGTALLLCLGLIAAAPVAGWGISAAMSAPPTSPTLLQRLRTPDDAAAWERFVEIYAPLLHRHALSRGLQPADACDVVQDAMRGIFLALPRFDYRPDKARFRSWLYRVAENQVRQFLRHGRRRPSGDGRTTLMQAAEVQQAAADEVAAEQRWQEAVRRQLFEWAVGKVQPEFAPRLWSAFWRTAVENEMPDKVAGDLGMTRAAVYMARSRCVARLRQCLAAAGCRDFDHEPPSSHD
jgi:RNA polymerase sigma factor (sigma-70 family)